MKGSAIDPLSINCSVSIEEMMSSTITQMEGTYVRRQLLMVLFVTVPIDIFVFKSVEYSAMEEDADADDDPILDQGLQCCRAIVYHILCI